MLDFNCLTYRSFYSFNDVLQLHDQNQDKSRRIIVEYQGAEYANLNHNHIESQQNLLLQFTQARYLSNRTEYIFYIVQNTTGFIDSFLEFKNHHIFQDSVSLNFLDFELHIPCTLPFITRGTLLNTIWSIFSFYGSSHSFHNIIYSTNYRSSLYFRRLDGTYTEVQVYGARSRCSETYPYLVPEHKNFHPLKISNAVQYQYTNLDGADQVLVVQWLKLLDTVFPDLIDTLEAQDALDAGALA